VAVATLSPTALSVRSAKPAYVYGATASIPLITSAANGLLRVGMPSDIPANATVTSAILTLTQSGAYSGANTLQMQRHSAGFAVSKATWNNRPGVSGAVVSVTQSGTADGTLWAFDVTADVQAFLAGTVTNYGWRLSTTSATSRAVRGSSASSGQPQLAITYLTPTDAPISLVPSGNQAVSLAKPWLTFQAPPDTTAINVQIDADMLSTYDFDSGDVLAPSGSLDLSTTAFAGLTAGTSRYWRARTKSALGYSAFSAWAQMQRVTKPTVTITSPGSTSDDTTPPIVWSVSGGTQTAWQVVITNSKGQVLADSGQIVGAATTYTPPKAVTTLGSTATVEVRVWDAVDRVATAGDPIYASATLTFTAAGTGSVTPALTVVATPDRIAPRVTITATRAAAPDSWSIVRDGTYIATGLSPASATLAPYDDWTADPNKPHVYRAAPFTTGVGTASGGPTTTVVPTCRGIWLVDPAAPSSRAVIWGDDGGSFDATELAVLHQPIAGPPVRRVAYRPPLSGSIGGELIDVGSLTADAQIAVLYDFKGTDRDLRLVLGDRNLLVRIGDVTISPLPVSNESERRSVVTFTWWQQDAPPWSP
jgi:hypothetical protein